LFLPLTSLSPGLNSLPGSRSLSFSASLSLSQPISLSQYLSPSVSLSLGEEKNRRRKNEKEEGVVKLMKITRQEKRLQYVKLVLQELCMILLYYCVFYKVSNTPFYRHRIIVGG
jgi:hypothetical protein